MRKISNVSILGLSLVLAACQSNPVSTTSEPEKEVSKPVVQQPTLAELIASNYNEKGPKLMVDHGSNKFWSHHERIYVTGSEDMAIKFYKYGHLPYTKTILGAGPQGETVVFEVNKDDANYADNLISTFEKTPFLIKSFKSVNVYALSGRLYITGQESTAEKFEKHGHLPYTKTLLGEGPNGETLVFEVSKDDANFADNLIQKYRDMPTQVLAKDDIILYKKGARLYAVATAEMAKKFEAHGHLPYTKTILGGGPEGETVVFEVDKDDVQVAENLISAFSKIPWQIKTCDNFNIYKKGERLYVTGDVMAEKFEAHGHLPYTKTILGAGPHGETVVFEVDKENADHADELIEKFEKTPWLLNSKEKYFVYKFGERIYVIGDNTTAQKFEKHGHLPYTKTFIGEGPQGETLVFEVNKGNPDLTDRLVSTYFKK